MCKFLYFCKDEDINLAHECTLIYEQERIWQICVDVHVGLLLVMSVLGQVLKSLILTRLGMYSER